MTECPLSEVARSPASTSYALPAVNDSNRNRGAALDWAHANSGKFIPAMIGDISKAIQEHEGGRDERGGEGTAWVSTGK